MWRLDGDNKLENKAGSWKYHNKQFSIPIGSTKGFIFDKESGYILGKKRVDDLFSKEIAGLSVQNNETFGPGAQCSETSHVGSNYT